MCIKIIEFNNGSTRISPRAGYEDNKFFVSYKIEVGGYYTKLMFPGDDRDWIPTYEDEKLELIPPDGFKEISAFKDIFSITYKEIEGVNYLIKIEAGYDDWLSF